MRDSLAPANCDAATLADIKSTIPKIEIELDDGFLDFFVYEGDLLLNEDQVDAALARLCLDAGIARNKRAELGALAPELNISLTPDGRDNVWPWGKRTLSYAVIRSSFPNGSDYDRVVSAMQQATAEWAAACPECGLSFEHKVGLDDGRPAIASDVPAADEVTFDVRYLPEGAEDTGLIASAFFPGDPLVKRHIFITPLYKSTRFDKVGVLRHELGHVLGYRHEHLGIAGCQAESDLNFRSVAGYTANSVMHYLCGGNGTSDLRIVEQDKIQHRSVYQAAASEGVAPQAQPGGGDFVPADLGALAGPARGTRPGSIVISFRGGDIGQEMAAVLAVLQSEPGWLQRMQTTVGDSGSFCKLLAARGYPPGCNALLPAMRKFNPGVSLERLQPDTPVALPVLTITSGEASRVLDAREVAQYESNRLFKWLGRDLTTRFSQKVLTYLTYRMQVPTVNDRQGILMAQALEPLRSKNLSISHFGHAPVAATAFFQPQPVSDASADRPQAPSAASDNPGCDGALITYLDLFDPPQGVQSLYGQIDPDHSETPTVYLIDGPIEQTPDLPLGGAVQLAEGTVCTLAPAVRPVDHATHLSGIIGGSGDFRYRGILPGVRLESLGYYAPKDPPNEDGTLQVAMDTETLAGRIERQVNRNFAIRPIFLAATSFQTNPLQMARIASGNSPPTLYAPNYTIVETDPIVVASAGQAQTDSEPLDVIKPTYGYSPQNLGDEKNVILVTACQLCRRERTTLMERAFRPALGMSSMISVVAPGGSEIEGWIDGVRYGKAGGTSQAAALVAGIVARMVTRYPNSYHNPATAKYWLSATSWPLLEGANHGPHVVRSVSAGLVDPWRAQLDPLRNYLRTRGGEPWKQVRLKRWSRGKVDVRSELFQIKESIDTSHIARVIRLSDGTDGKGTFALQLSVRNPTGGGPVAGKVQSKGPVTFAEDLALVACEDDTRIEMKDVEEVILSVSRLDSAGNACD